MDIASLLSQGSGSSEKAAQNMGIGKQKKDAADDAFKRGETQSGVFYVW